MDNQPNIGFVDAHAEGIGGCNGAMFTFNESLLDIFLGLRRQACVKMSRRNLLQLKELRNLFALVSGSAVDDCAARYIRRK